MTIISPSPLKTIKHGLVEGASSIVHRKKFKDIRSNVTKNFYDEDKVDLKGSPTKGTTSLDPLRNKVVPSL